MRSAVARSGATSRSTATTRPRRTCARTMAETAAPERLPTRQDGAEKVTGHGRYTADLTRTGMLHAAFRYADHTHARILSIDTGRARALPGVHAVLTHA